MKKHTPTQADIGEDEEEAAGEGEGGYDPLAAEGDGLEEGGEAEVRVLGCLALSCLVLSCRCCGGLFWLVLSGLLLWR